MKHPLHSNKSIFFQKNKKNYPFFSRHSVDVLIMKGWFEDWRFIGGLQKGSTTIQNSFNSDCHFFLTTPNFQVRARYFPLELSKGVIVFLLILLFFYCWNKKVIYVT